MTCWSKARESTDLEPDAHQRPGELCFVVAAVVLAASYRDEVLERMSSSLTIVAEPMVRSAPSNKLVEQAVAKANQ